MVEEDICGKYNAWSHNSTTMTTVTISDNAQPGASDCPLLHKIGAVTRGFHFNMSVPTLKFLLLFSKERFSFH